MILFLRSTAGFSAWGAGGQGYIKHRLVSKLYCRIVGGFSAQKPGEHEYIKKNRVKLKFCMFCLTESTAQADNQGNMQGKISIEDFLGLE